MKKIFLLIVLTSGCIFTQIMPQLNAELTAIRLDKRSDVNYSSFFIANASEKRSVPLAILFSALLPGMGEYYAGSFSSGQHYTMIEGGLWLTYAGMSYYSDLQKTNYKEYAKTHGGVTAEGPDDDYYANIGLYSNIEQYNDEMAFTRSYSSMYNPALYSWHWQTQSERKSYREMWTSANQANNNLRFVVGAMVLNRVISIINAVRLVNAHNKNLAAPSPVSIDIMPDLQNRGFSAGVSFQF